MSTNHTAETYQMQLQVSRSSAKKAAVSSASSTPSKCGLNPTVASDRLPWSKGLGIPGLPHSSAPSRSSSTSFRSEASWSEVKQWILANHSSRFPSWRRSTASAVMYSKTLKTWPSSPTSTKISWAFQHISMHLRPQTSVSTPFSAKGALAPSVFSAILGKAMLKMKRWRVTKTRSLHFQHIIDSINHI